MPTIQVDLSSVGIDPFFIPGLVREIIDPVLIPVELLSFSAVSEAGIVKLAWSTATETNNSRFQIERTTPQSPPWQGGEGEARDGWKKIGFVNGSGTTTETRDYSYIDRTVNAGTYFYRLKQIDFNGQYEYSDEIEVVVYAPLTFRLGQNYPNPFNPSTTIKYAISSKQFVSIKVYDVLGNEIATLVNEEKPAGVYQVEFNEIGLPSGTYFYRLQAGAYIQTKKMLLIK
ncbi:MAG: T9SS type A sorting domain-containing protein [Ignavibacterium sp.]|nr:MAG: T9SS type A sorting domain-containing protein [Ignavibacterium sp.]